ncbi:5-histidylcysteine sulfoxide synthase [Vibrio sp.]|nr:5-histidylcysteine sulfoxide synthase [Vibrio sp.]
MFKQLSVPPDLTTKEIETVRHKLLNYFRSTYSEYEKLFSTLSSEESYYQKPITLRHPLIFYFGHTATFFINKLLMVGLIEKRLNPKFESMFAVGVDEMSWDDLDETHYEWPSVEQVKAYRDEVRFIVEDLIMNAPLTTPINWSNPFWAIAMAIEHERIHLETSSVLIRQHSISYVNESDDYPIYPESGVAPKNTLITVNGGRVSLGKTYDDRFYGWDNEYGQHKAKVDAFQASQFLVSNGEYLEFVHSNGYQLDKYWEKEGLSWRQYTNAICPEFWIEKNGAWYYRTMTSEIEMPWDWPVDVNYHEAKAFCNWKSEQSGQCIRLPTEDEWWRMVEENDVAAITQDEPTQANIGLVQWASSCPVNMFKQGDLYDIVGNVWQWTETPTYPFEGFDVHPIYDDFTTPTFDSRHNIIKGGSWISTGNEALPWSRYAFRRHFFQHAGFRYVLANELPNTENLNYETDKMLSEYAEFHYGDQYFSVPNFPKALVEYILANISMPVSPSTALDIGCAVGRGTFELAKHFTHVTGIDFSARFINIANQLQTKGLVRYSLADEGDLVFYKERSLSELELSECSDKVAFYQGDACNLKPHFNDYDLVLAANLIDRLYDPAKFLRSISEKVKSGGYLVIASPYTWLEEFTKKKDWLGGYKKDGETYRTFDGISDILSEQFSLVAEPQNIPFVIRETSHKFQHSLSEVTIWQKK